MSNQNKNKNNQETIFTFKIYKNQIDDNKSKNIKKKDFFKFLINLLYLINPVNLINPNFYL
jgi:hypothetical protein